VWAASAAAVPFVDLCLQRVALGQKRAVLRREGGDDRLETLPECIGRDPGARQRFLSNEGMERCGDLQLATGDISICRHAGTDHRSLPP